MSEKPTVKKHIDRCPYCYAERPFDLWVFAHWTEVLTTVCESCGKTYACQRGISYTVRQPKKVKAVVQA